MLNTETKLYLSEKQNAQFDISHFLFKENGTQNKMLHQYFSLFLIAS